MSWFRLRFGAWTIEVAGRSYDLRVLAGLVLASVALGVLNNMRVYEEQRVPWLGIDAVSDAGEGDR